MVRLVLDERDGIVLEVFADTSHAVHRDAKGHSRAITHIDNASVYTSSIKQKVMPRSSFEAGLPARINSHLN